MSDDNWTAAVLMLQALAAVPPESRLDVLALVNKVVIERPDYVDIIARSKK